MKLLLIIALTPILFAAENKPVPAAMEAEFYRTDAALARMQPGWEAANVARQSAVDEITKFCGDKAMPQPMDKHIVCVPKPEPKPEAKATPAAPAPKAKE